MKCIKQKQIITSEIVIKKSRFIGYLKYISSEEEAKDFIQEIKVLHKDARHNCSAYVVGNIKKKDDDGEPSSTAGQPILDVLEYNEINNICAVVTRYFGGIKLGAGGLTRAYSKATSNVLEHADLKTLKSAYRVKLIFNYTNVKIIDYFFLSNGIIILDKKFDNKIIYEFDILKEEYGHIENLLNSIDHTMEIKKIDDTYISI